MEAEKTWTTKIRVDEHYFADRKFADLLPENVKNTSHFLITDSNVDELYAEQVLSTLAAAGFKVLKIVIPPNEISKSMVRYVEILDRILASGLDKHSRILSLGGGVVNNIAGFLASTIYRGLHLIHIATTTLSQVDAAIDFKQAINAKYGKNLVGSFYPADFVIVDPTVCLTLTDRDFYNGLSESLKHALAQDKELFNYLIENASRARNADVLTHITKKTIEAKLEVMNQADPLLVEEMIKQYGHAIGHAIEHLSRGKLLHGEAIAIGMTLSARIGEYLHISPPELTEKHRSLFSLYQLPCWVPDYIESDAVIDVIKYDKHFVNGKASMMILEEIGQPRVYSGQGFESVDLALVKRAVEECRR